MPFLFCNFKDSTTFPIAFLKHKTAEDFALFISFFAETYLYNDNIGYCMIT